jgi:hypothetical protein
MGTWESFGTPENLELDCRGQITLPWTVLYTVGKVLKRGCGKWPCMSNSDIRAQVMCKRRVGSQMAVWLLTTKSQESTQFPSVQATCDMPLESSRRGLKLCFRPHHDRRSAQEVMHPQSCGSPSCCNFGTPKRESRDKKPFGCRPRGVPQSILYGGRWWLPSSSGRGSS